MLLTLDTSTLTLVLGLFAREAGSLREVESVAVGPPRKQSELLPLELDALLGRHGVSLGSLEAVVVGLGPGSFTGLRVGLATAKAACYAQSVPLVGVSSLAALALEGPPERPVWATAVARVGELYIARYLRRGDEVSTLEAPRAVPPGELGALLAQDPDAYALGPSVPPYRSALLEAGARAEQLLEGPVVPAARALALLARPPFRFDRQAVFALEPQYVRASEAERNPKFPAPPGPAPTARLRED